jgi:hypothetical protein
MVVAAFPAARRSGARGARNAPFTRGASRMLRVIVVVPDLAVAAHRMPIWWAQVLSLSCSVNDAVNVLPCSICAYLNGRPS